MINIAICDDDLDFLTNFEENIIGIFQNKGVDIYINKFTDSLKFIQEFEKNFYNLIFLDICMPNVNGLQVAEKIRNIDKACEIVFVTAFDRCVYRTFKYRPFRFIRKNRLNDEIVETIEEFIIAFKNNYNKSISFKIKDGYINVNKNEILYFDIENRKVRLHMRDNIYYLSSVKFIELSERLDNNGFISVHRSYLVNKCYIREYKKSTLILDNNENIPVSRYKATEIEAMFKNTV
ncbi:MAG: LytR/AlgR family response regulator transcription factor [Clostridium sp.]|uniref:LytR/AlgR family response regulator transcription factor n=1 Tax=Clostridium sp. TaxID=1506 RepID=UPI003F39950E